MNKNRSPKKSTALRVPDQHSKGAVTVHFSTRFALLALSVLASILKGTHALITVANSCAAFFK